MKTALTCLAVPLFALIVLADNPTHLGEALPPLTFGRAANGVLPEKSVADFGGDVLFIVHYRTSCPGCVAILPGLEKARARYDRPDVHVIGLTNDSVDLTRRYLVHEAVGRKLDIPIAVRSNGNHGVSRVPMGYVVGRDGKVVWAGNPNASYAKDLAAAVAGTDPAIADAGRAAKKALDLVYRRRYAKALSAAEKLDRAAADYVRGRVALYFGRRIAAAGEALGRGDVHAAHERLALAKDEFAGTAHEATADAKLADLEVREGFEVARRNWKQLHDCWAMARTGKAAALTRVAARLRSLIEEGGDPALAKEAEDLLAVVTTDWSLEDATRSDGGCAAR